MPPPSDFMARIMKQADRRMTRSATRCATPAAPPASSSGDGAATDTAAKAPRADVGPALPKTLRAPLTANLPTRSTEAAKPMRRIADSRKQAPQPKANAKPKATAAPPPPPAAASLGTPISQTKSYSEVCPCSPDPPQDTLKRFGMEGRQSAAAPSPAASQAPASKAEATPSPEPAQMRSILQSRLRQLQAARTMCRRGDDALIDHILNVKDAAVTVDLLPILTTRLAQGGTACTMTSGGFCELLPTLKDLLESQFEDYVLRALGFIRAGIDRWGPESGRRAGGRKENKRPGFRGKASANVSALSLVLLSMAPCFARLSRAAGTVGNQAQAINRIVKRM